MVDEEQRRRDNYRAKMRRRKRRNEDPEFRAAEARWSRAYRDRKRGGPPQRRPKKMDQPFTKDELEAAARVIELLNRGGDASIILRGEAHRSYTAKLFAMRDKARKRANAPTRVVG